MYLTQFSMTKSWILKADMDGHNIIVVAHETGYPMGIAVDFWSSLIFWARAGASLGVMTSNLHGKNVQVVAEDEIDFPYGIAVSESEIFWGSQGGKVKSSSKLGVNITVLYNGTAPVRHIVLANRLSSTRSRSNDCFEVCVGICVLTPASFRCLFPESFLGD